MLVSRISRYFAQILNRDMQQQEMGTVFYFSSDEFYSPAGGFPVSDAIVLVFCQMRCPLSGDAFFLF